MATQMLPPALVPHDDESSTGSSQRLITDAVRNVAANDYCRRLRSANKRVNTSANEFAESIAKASERLSLATVGPTQSITRCAEQLREVDAKMKAHAMSVIESQAMIQENMKIIDDTTKELATRSSGVLEDLRSAVAACKASLGFAVELNGTSIIVSLVGLVLTLFYVFLEFAFPTSVSVIQTNRLVILWLGSVSLAIGLAFHAYLVYSSGPDLRKLRK